MYRNLKYGGSKSFKVFSNNGSSISLIGTYEIDNMYSHYAGPKVQGGYVVAVNGRRYLINDALTSHEDLGAFTGAFRAFLSEIEENYYYLVTDYYIYKYSKITQSLVGTYTSGSIIYAPTITESDVYIYFIHSTATLKSVDKATMTSVSSATFSNMPVARGVLNDYLYYLSESSIYRIPIDALSSYVNTPHASTPSIKGGVVDKATGYMYYNTPSTVYKVDLSTRAIVASDSFGNTAYTKLFLDIIDDKLLLSSIYGLDGYVQMVDLDTFTADTSLLTVSNSYPVNMAVEDYVDPNQPDYVTITYTVPITDFTIDSGYTLQSGYLQLQTLKRTTKTGAFSKTGLTYMTAGVPEGAVVIAVTPMIDYQVTDWGTGRTSYIQGLLEGSEKMYKTFTGLVGTWTTEIGSEFGPPSTPITSSSDIDLTFNGYVGSTSNTGSTTHRLQNVRLKIVYYMPSNDDKEGSVAVSMPADVAAAARKSAATSFAASDTLDVAAQIRKGAKNSLAYSTVVDQTLTYTKVDIQKEYGTVTVVNGLQQYISGKKLARAPPHTTTIEVSVGSTAAKNAEYYVASSDTVDVSVSYTFAEREELEGTVAVTNGVGSTLVVKKNSIGSAGSHSLGVDNTAAGRKGAISFNDYVEPQRIRITGENESNYSTIHLVDSSTYEELKRLNVGGRFRKILPKRLTDSYGVDFFIGSYNASDYELFKVNADLSGYISDVLDYTSQRRFGVVDIGDNKALVIGGAIDIVDKDDLSLISEFIINYNLDNSQWVYHNGFIYMNRFGELVRYDIANNTLLSNNAVVLAINYDWNVLLAVVGDNVLAIENSTKYLCTFNKDTLALVYKDTSSFFPTANTFTARFSTQDAVYYTETASYNIWRLNLSDLSWTNLGDYGSSIYKDKIVLSDDGTTMVITTYGSAIAVVDVATNSIITSFSSTDYPSIQSVQIDDKPEEAPEFVVDSLQVDVLVTGEAYEPVGGYADIHISEHLDNTVSGFKGINTTLTADLYDSAEVEYLKGTLVDVAIENDLNVAASQKKNAEASYVESIRVDTNGVVTKKVSETLAESLPVDTSVNTAKSSIVALQHSIEVTDSVSAIKSQSVTLTDSIELTDSVAASKKASVDLAYSSSTEESVLASKASSGQLVDSIGIDITLEYSYTTSSEIALHHRVTTTMAGSKNSSEGVSDAIVANVDTSATKASSSTLADSITESSALVSYKNSIATIDDTNGSATAGSGYTGKASDLSTSAGVNTDTTAIKNSVDTVEVSESVGESSNVAKSAYVVIGESISLRVSVYTSGSVTGIVSISEELSVSATAMKHGSGYFENSGRVDTALAVAKSTSYELSDSIALDDNVTTSKNSSAALSDSIPVNVNVATAEASTGAVEVSMQLVDSVEGSKGSKADVVDSTAVAINNAGTKASNASIIITEYAESTGQVTRTAYVGLYSSLKPRVTVITSESSSTTVSISEVINTMVDGKKHSTADLQTSNSLNVELSLAAAKKTTIAIHEHCGTEATCSKGTSADATSSDTCTVHVVPRKLAAASNTDSLTVNTALVGSKGFNVIYTDYIGHLVYAGGTKDTFGSFVEHIVVGAEVVSTKSVNGIAETSTKETTQLTVSKMSYSQLSDSLAAYVVVTYGIYLNLYRIGSIEVTYTIEAPVVETIISDTNELFEHPPIRVTGTISEVEDLNVTMFSPIEITVTIGETIDKEVEY